LVVVTGTAGTPKAGFSFEMFVLPVVVVEPAPPPNKVAAVLAGVAVDAGVAVVPKENPPKLGVEFVVFDAAAELPNANVEGGG
jgi:hypothetical protein